MRRKGKRTKGHRQIAAARQRIKPTNNIQVSALIAVSFLYLHTRTHLCLRIWEYKYMCTPICERVRATSLWLSWTDWLFYFKFFLIYIYMVWVVAKQSVWSLSRYLIFLMFLYHLWIFYTNFKLLMKTNSKNTYRMDGRKETWRSTTIPPLKYYKYNKDYN